MLQKQQSPFFSAALCWGPWWSIRDFHWRFLCWQEQKRDVSEVSSKIIKGNWRKTHNKEWGANCMKLLLWETRAHSSVLTFLATLKPLQKQTLLLVLSCCWVQGIMTLELPEIILRELRPSLHTDLSVVLSIIRLYCNHRHSLGISSSGHDLSSDCLITWYVGIEQINKYSSQ